MRRVYLDTGNLTDAELGINRDLARQMQERPASHNERVLSTVTRNGNVVTRRGR